MALSLMRERETAYNQEMSRQPRLEESQGTAAEFMNSIAQKDPKRRGNCSLLLDWTAN